MQMASFLENIPGEPLRLVVINRANEEVASMKIDDIKNVLKLAQAEFDDGFSSRSATANENFAKSIEALETWLREVGVTVTVKPERGAKVLDARSRAAGKAGTKRRQRS